VPDRDEHLRVATRFESFAKSIEGQPYIEWLVIVWFHIALHYADAFLATKGHLQISNHTERWSKCGQYSSELGAVEDDLHQLYKDAREARYDAGQFTPRDLEPIRKRYERVRAEIRRLLAL
jgi:CHAD domain-containing protein